MAVHSSYFAFPHLLETPKSFNIINLFFSSFTTPQVSSLFFLASQYKVNISSLVVVLSERFDPLNWGVCGDVRLGWGLLTLIHNAVHHNTLCMAGCRPANHRKKKPTVSLHKSGPERRQLWGHNVTYKSQIKLNCPKLSSIKKRLNPTSLCSFLLQTF